MRNLLLSAFVILTVAGCSKESDPYYKEITYYFNDDLQGWQSLFSDYPLGEEEFYELEFGMERLPLPLDTTLNSVRISGNNHSDDLLTIMYVPISGLSPNTTYDVTFVVQLASNVATNSVGIGGSPDLSLGVGGLDTIPSNMLDENNYYRPEFESQLQSHLSNDVLQVIGTLGVRDTTTVYAPKSLSNYNTPMPLTSNSDGKIYAMLGWDSGFEGKTTIYIKTIIIRLEYRD